MPSALPSEDVQVWADVVEMASVFRYELPI